MDSVIQYVIESALSLGLFTILYFLLLQKETFFKMNRFFLLLALLFSLSLPMIHLRVYETQSIMLSEIVVSPSTNMLEAVSIYGNNISVGVASSISASFWLIVIYLSGVCFFFMRMVIRIAQIIRLIRKNEVQYDKDIKLVFLNGDIGPFSFLSWVFIGRNVLQMKGWEKMLAHELEHIKQGHTFDILVMEIIAIFQWFNPFFWLMKRMIQENHEYLADQAVLKDESDPVFYKEVLITRFIGSEIRIVSYFNYSLIKKRIKMMSKIKSTRLAGLKLFAAMFVAIGLIILFACEQKEITQNEVEKFASIKMDDSNTFKISGDSLTIEKFKKILAQIPGAELTQTSSSELTIIGNQRVGELVVVGYGKSGETKTETAGTDEVFVVVDEMPEFPGGDKALVRFLAENVKYPVIAQEQGIQGKVFVSFVVNKEGDIEDVKVSRGVDPSLDKEAVRVVSSLPRWKPGKQHGKLVKVSFTVPINFTLQ